MEQNDENKKTTTNQKLGGCLILAIITFIIFFSVKSCFSSTPEEDKEKNESNIKMKVLTYSQLCVKEKLKSPASAEFPVDLNNVKIVNDSTFIINSYVDSQNSFGAMLRMNYLCEIIISKDTYKCNYVELYER